jgi:hypothetical protein
MTRLLPRGRVAKWDQEKIDTLSTLELRQLLANAEQLNEPEVAALCNAALDARPRGRAAVRKTRPNGARRLVARGKAFEAHGIALRNRSWSRGGVRPEDGVVVLAIPYEEVQKAEGLNSHRLWAPNTDGTQAWSDSPGGQERLEHCRTALDSGAAEGMLVYAKTEGNTSASGVDVENILKLKVEQRGEEFWATWPEIRRTTVTSMN